MVCNSGEEETSSIFEKKIKEVRRRGDETIANLLLEGMFGESAAERVPS
jgi:hypothetical protein